MNEIDMIEEEWMKINSQKGMELSYYIQSLLPDIGHTIKVNELEIPKNYFHNEYNQIWEAYISVLEKLQEYHLSQRYHENKKKTSK